MTKRDFVSALGTSQSDADGCRGHWTEREVDETAFKDARLGRRFGEVIRQIGDGMGESFPYACQDWASTKAAYRFLRTIGSRKRKFSAVTSPRPVPALPLAAALFC